MWHYKRAQTGIMRKKDFVCQPQKSTEERLAFGVILCFPSKIIKAFEGTLTPNDFRVTVDHIPGVDYHQSFLDQSGRPMPILPYGKPIDELLPVT